MPVQALDVRFVKFSRRRQCFIGVVVFAETCGCPAGKGQSISRREKAILVACVQHAEDSACRPLAAPRGVQFGKFKTGAPVVSLGAYCADQGLLGLFQPAERPKQTTARGQHKRVFRPPGQ